MDSQWGETEESGLKVELQKQPDPHQSILRDALIIVYTWDVASSQAICLFILWLLMLTMQKWLLHNMMEISSERKLLFSGISC